MSLLGLSNMNQSQAVRPVSPVRQVPERSTQTEAPQEVVKTPKYDSYTPSEEGLEHVQTMSADSGVADMSVESTDMAEVDNLDGSYGSPTTMPETEQELGAAIPDDLIDPTDVSNAETYDPSAWLEAYREEKENPNTTEIGPSSGLAAADEVTPEDTEDVIDPTDFTNTETYEPSAWLEAYRNESASASTEDVDSSTEVTPEDSAEEDILDSTDYTNSSTYNPYAWLSEYRGTTTPEYGTVETTKDTTETTTEVEESTEESAESSFDLQSFLSESDSIAKEVVSQLTNTISAYSDSQNWLELLQSSNTYI